MVLKYTRLLFALLAQGKRKKQQDHLVVGSRTNTTTLNWGQLYVPPPPNIRLKVYGSEYIGREGRARLRGNDGGNDTETARERTLSNRHSKIYLITAVCLFLFWLLGTIKADMVLCCYDGYTFEHEFRLLTNCKHGVMVSSCHFSII